MFFLWAPLSVCSATQSTDSLSAVRLLPTMEDRHATALLGCPLSDCATGPHTAECLSTCAAVPQAITCCSEQHHVRKTLKDDGFLCAWNAQMQRFRNRLFMYFGPFDPITALCWWRQKIILYNKRTSSRVRRERVDVYVLESLRGSDLRAGGRLWWVCHDYFNSVSCQLRADTGWIRRQQLVNNRS